MMQDTADARAIVDNLAQIRERLAAAAARARRAADEITLVAVSKQKPLALIEALYAAGQRDFGENRFDEARSKVEAARSSGLDEIRWHFIGTIQSRQTSSAIGPFALLHGVDRLKIARRLSRDVSQLAKERAADAAGGNFLPDENVLSTLLQVNVSGEASKHGFAPDALVDAASKVNALPDIRARGLMTMAPYALEAEAARPVFRQLRTLRDQLVAQDLLPNDAALSMGMTNDFEVAIEEGATIVRIGSAIFGER